jgi:hypothetical protein
MFGVHEELPLFIAVDPAMHNPTWFSRSIEFKEADLDLAVRHGWHGWERPRLSEGRRRDRPLPQQDLRTEILVALRPENFLKYAMFERIATGNDPGERLLLADTVGKQLHSSRSSSRLLAWPSAGTPGDELAKHPLVRQLALEPHEILDIIGERFRLFAALRGGVAEHHLGQVLRAVPGVSRVDRLDKDGQPDFEIEYRKRPIRIECKNVLRRLLGKSPHVDFQKTRASKSDPCSRYYKRSHFEVLAACLHPLTTKWEFRFCPTAALMERPRCPGHLSERVLVEGQHWNADLALVLDGMRRRSD